MGRIGSLHDWMRFLEARTDHDAVSLLITHRTKLDQIYDELNAVIRCMWDSPGGEVAETLLIARMAVADAAGMLDGVCARFRDGEREPA